MPLGPAPVPRPTTEWDTYLTQSSLNVVILSPASRGVNLYANFARDHRVLPAGVPPSVRNAWVPVCLCGGPEASPTRGQRPINLRAASIVVFCESLYRG